MDRSPVTNSCALPGTGVLILCVVMLLAGYVAAAMRPPVATSVAEETAAAKS